MLYVARLYKYVDTMLICLISSIVLAICLKLSIIREEKKKAIRTVPKMIILNNTTDASANVKSLLRVPGTDFLFIPVYSYIKNGREYTTLSYRKCKRAVSDVYKRKKR